MRIAASLEREFKAGLLGLSVIGLAACATRARVVSTTTSGVDLAQYKTFNVESAPGDPTDPPKAEISRALVDDVTAELEARGLQVDAKNPDLSFSYATGRRTKKARFSERHGYLGSGDEWDYQEGALVISAMDTRTNKLVWTAHAQAVIDPRDKSHRQLKRAIQKAFKDYPHR